MKKKNILLVFALIVSMLSFAQKPQGGQNGSSQRQRMSPEDMSKRQTERMVKQLKLDEAQTVKVQAINLDFSEKMKTAFESAQDDRSSMRSKMETIRNEKNAELKTVLTEEQYKKYLEDEKTQMEERKSRQANGTRGQGRGQSRGDGQQRGGGQR